MRLKKVKVLSGRRRPETHCRLAHGYQRAGALTGSINNFESTIIPLNEVENQKIFNTKLGKQATWFSEAIKDFYHYFQKNEVGRHKKIESIVALHSWSLINDITRSYD